jgi:hypothetical protein
MLEMMKKWKAVLSVISLFVCSYARADAGLGASQDQNVDVFSPSSLAVNLHATFNRLPLRNRKALARQVHAPEAYAFVLAAIYSFELHLPSFGPAPTLVVSSTHQSCTRIASALAPPLS